VASFAQAATTSGTVIKTSGRLLFPTTTSTTLTTLLVLPDRKQAGTAQFTLEGVENQKAVAQVQPAGGTVTLSDGEGHTLTVYDFLYADYAGAGNVQQIGSGSGAYAEITYPATDSQPIVLGIGGYLDIPSDQASGTYTGTAQLKICDGTSLDCSGADEHVTSFEIYASVIKAGEIRKIKDMTFPPMYSPSSPVYGHLVRATDPGAAVFAISGDPGRSAHISVGPLPITLTRQGGAPGDPTITVTNIMFAGCDKCDPALSPAGGNFGLPPVSGATEIYLGGLEDIPANCPSGVYKNDHVTFTFAYN